MRTLVVIGNGMVGQHLVESLVADGVVGSIWRVVVVGEEPRRAYDRVHLSSYLDGASVDALGLVSEEVSAHPHVEYRVGERVIDIDVDGHRLTTDRGQDLAWDHLVLATGSRPFVPPVPGHDAAGAFVYRTIEDLDAIREWSADVADGVVIGGGLLGLEAANALRLLGLRTHVVEMAPRLMPVQVDDGGGAALAARIAELGIDLHLGVTTEEIETDAAGRVSGIRFADGTRLGAGIVVFSAGIRPCDELARGAGLEVGDRGGVVIDDRGVTSAPDVSAIGEVACHRGRVYGLVAPGQQMARVVARRLGGTAGPDDVFVGADMSTRLKLLGVEVASFGEPHAQGDDVRAVTVADDHANTYARLVVAGTGPVRVVGGVLVGDSSRYPGLHGRMVSGEPVDDPMALLVGPVDDGDATVCTCNHVSASVLRGAVADGACTVADLKACTAAGTSCGSCVPDVGRVLRSELARLGVAVDHGLCEHFDHTRQELFEIAAVHEVTTFADLIGGWGRGGGCEVCKPTVASILASLWNEHVLDPDHAGLQDSNDFVLANLQRNGTYSVIPRVPGGEITPDKLAVLAEVARDFDLYTKITGGQRIDLLGARIDQLPDIWRRLVDAGFESGHAYGKAVRTVKSCVGESWCRYGLDDSTGLAIALEERYRGLRSPHKLKMAVSGCARECAEAQSKDVGVIATEGGWTLYVAGNGGMRPRHATLLAADLDTDELIRLIDRFVMFYVRTADRLERTSVWFERLEGGIDHLRAVLIDDALGLADALDAHMERHVATYRCEWAATLEDPTKLARFRHFVNSEAPDPGVRFDRVRGQIQPAAEVDLAPTGDDLDATGSETLVTIGASS